MDEKEKELFLLSLSEKLPEIEVEDLSVRNITGDIYQFIIFGSTIGLFSGLWNFVKYWVDQKSIAKIKITYTSQDGQKVDVEYTSLTKTEAEKIINKFPPKVEHPIKILIPKS